MTLRSLRLTPDLVARVHQLCDDPGQEPGLPYHSEVDYDEIVTTLLRDHPEGQDAWMFAYGSLLWKPEIAHSGELLGIARGWRRSFCLKINRWRGTRERPGLMMALDRGGQCKGVALRLGANQLVEGYGKLVRREMSVKPPNNIPRWIDVDTQHGRLKALAFVSNRKGRAYMGQLTIEQVADTLAQACGHWGSGAEYLLNTIVHLEKRGIHDSYLWRLQDLVAERIANLP
jgi:glutathione-specific gamma-glutamylcyclotransferase